MELLAPRLEPDAAASTQRLGLLDLGQPEQLAEESPCFGLTPAWGGNLHMVKSFDEHARNVPQQTGFRLAKGSPGALLCPALDDGQRGAADRRCFGRRRGGLQNRQLLRRGGDDAAGGLADRLRGW